jgi:hypothetical protein
MAKQIGPSFLSEIRAAGLWGLEFCWSEDGRLEMDRLTPEQRAAVLAVYEAHDPDAEPPLMYRRRRAAAYRDQLGAEQGDFINTLGDVLDVLIAQVESMRAEIDAARTPEFAAMLGKIASIKAANPKPD